MTPDRFLIPHSSFLIKKKNLLAFSSGVDSSALFFLLLENDIPFDIAIVDYGVRAQSGEEVAHAKALAEEYGLRCFTTKAPQFESHFECRARKFRYGYFESIIQKHGYDNLLTAHQLNDRMEWMLMRLSKGAGLSEMVGMESVQPKDGYTLIRPLLGYTKQELLEYLEANGYPYFVDESNSDEKYERNYFRKHFADPLIERYSEGIARSFEYLTKDREIIDAGYEVIYAKKDMKIIRLHNPSLKTRAVDQTLKQLGYLLSAQQRVEVEDNDSVVIGGKWAVELSGDLLYIAPFMKVDMPKEFREQCRTQHIPPKVRSYFFKEKLL